MDINKVHPQLRKKIRCFPRFPVHNRFVLALMKWGGKRQRRPSSLHGVSITDEQLGHASVRIYRPQGTLSGAGMLWIHGGGLVIGSNAIYDRECALYARDLNMVVVSAGYRLAPEHPFPAALDDCHVAWQWLQSNSKTLGIDSDRVVVSGQSAGGGLAASLVQRLRDEGGTQPVAQALLCPMLDDRTAANRTLDAINHRIWNNKSNRFGWSSYLGHDVGRPQVAQYAVPARQQDLANLPPAWIGVGDIDLFCEENREYAARLQAAGVPCTFEVIAGAPHAFELLVPGAPISQEFSRSNYAFLRSMLVLEKPPLAQTE